MNDYLNPYEKYLIQTGAAQNTVASYLCDVKMFIDYCTNHDIHLIQDIDEFAVSDYINYCRETNKTQSTINRTTAALKSYFSFMKLRRHIKSNPAENIKVHAVKSKLPDVLTAREINLLCDSFKPDTAKNNRDSMMIHLCCSTGISVSELCMLDLGDVNLNIGILRVKSSDTPRTIPLDDNTRRMLQVYIKSHRTSLVEESRSNALFPNIKGGRMSRQGFWKILKSRAEAVKLGKEITPNTLRFTYALSLIEDGDDTSYIVDIMGYSNASALKKFAKINKEKYSDTSDKRRKKK